MTGEVTRSHVDEVGEPYVVAVQPPARESRKNFVCALSPLITKLLAPSWSVRNRAWYPESRAWSASTATSAEASLEKVQWQWRSARNHVPPVGRASARANHGPPNRAGARAATPRAAPPFSSVRRLRPRWTGGVADARNSTSSWASHMSFPRGPHDDVVEGDGNSVITVPEFHTRHRGLRRAAQHR